MTAILLVIIKVAVAGMIFATGMMSRASDALDLIREPAIVLRSLLAIYVVVPAVVLLGSWLLPLPTNFKVGLLVLAASGGAPLLPQRLVELGNRGYILGLVVLSSLLAIVVVPLTLRTLAPVLGVPMLLATGSVARALAVTLLIPLLAGMAIGGFWPKLRDSLAHRLFAVLGAALLGSALLLLALNWQVLVGAGWLALATLLLFSASALAVGHLIGGPDPADRAALAVICSTRHLGVVALLAASLPGPRTLVLMLAYVLAAAAVTLPYLRWMRGRVGRAPR